MKRSAVYKNEFAVSYTEYGSETGFPILIHHGLIASIDDHEIFNRLVELGARLLCIARPGYGASAPYAMQNIGEWADVAAVVIDALQVRCPGDVVGRTLPLCDRLPVLGSGTKYLHL